MDDQVSVPNKIHREKWLLQMCVHEWNITKYSVEDEAEDDNDNNDNNNGVVTTKTKIYVG